MPIRSNPPASRLLLLMCLSAVLCTSFIMALLTPLPLTIALILYGKKKASLSAAACLLIISFLSVKLFGDFSLIFIYASSYIISFVTVEIINQEIHPFKGMVKFGFLIVFSLFVLISGFFIVKGENPKVFIQKRIEQMTDKVKENQKTYMSLNKGKEAREILDIFNRPEELAEDIFSRIPYSLFVLVFLSIWLNLFLILRGKVVYQNFINISHTEKDLLNFKMPEYMIWPVIVVFVLMLSDKYLGKGISVLALNAMVIIGLFYFFQGLGILVDLLDRLKLGGFFRSLLLVLTVVTSYRFLAIIGLFDMWVDFKKLFNKKINRGDK